MTYKPKTPVKYKKCCLRKEQESPSNVQSQTAPQVSLSSEIKKIQATAAAKKTEVRELGVFVLFSSDSGDAWLLEVSEMDAVMLARKGAELEVSIEENPSTIEVNWSHTFEVKDDKLLVTGYKDKQITAFDKVMVMVMVMVIGNRFFGLRQKTWQTGQPEQQTPVPDS